MTDSRPMPDTGGQPNSGAPRIPFWAGRWYFAITIVSVGLLAWVPFVHAAGRLHRRSTVILAAAYGAAVAASLILLTVAPIDAERQRTDGGGMLFNVVGELLLLSVIIAACIQQVSLRRMVYGGTPQTSRAVKPAGVDHALAAALGARARRTAVRKLAAGDPLIARDLHIGRPDLPNPYDDGGLVDLNSAPAAVIAAVCDLTTDTADSIVLTRTACGGFLTVDDVFTLADVPYATWTMIRDRGIIIPR